MTSSARVPPSAIEFKAKLVHRECFSRKRCGVERRGNDLRPVLALELLHDTTSNDDAWQDGAETQGKTPGPDVGQHETSDERGDEAHNHWAKVEPN